MRTTAFGSTTSIGLQGAHDRGLSVRVLNPRRGTFHPKLYLSRHGRLARAAIGSANLAGGLVSNIESVAVLSGDADAPVLRQLWELGESWWRHDAAVDWSPVTAVALGPDEAVVPKGTARKPNSVRRSGGTPGVAQRVAVGLQPRRIGEPGVQFGAAFAAQLVEAAGAARTLSACWR